MSQKKYYKFVTYVPEKQVELVKRALFDKGAGRLGNYQQCCWQVLGTGQFCPVAGSRPFIGTENQLSTVPEWRIELLVVEECLAEVIQAMHDSHPYESPAYEVIELASEWM